MPKKSNKYNSNGRGGKLANPEDKHYFGHDDRVVRTDGGAYVSIRPRVSFKAQRRPTREVPWNWDRGALASSWKNDDAPMATGSNNNSRQVVIRGRERGIPRGRLSPLPHRGFRGQIVPRMRQVPIGEPNWYKITIPYGHKYEKDYVISNLNSYIAPDTFVPIMYKIAGNEANFFVDDRKIATALLNSDRKITTTDGFKLLVRVSKPQFPQCEIDEKLKERLKQAMAKRYVQETNALDLSRFHQDTDLVSDYFFALFRPVLLKAVLDIVAEHIPTLQALNLDGNRLHLIEKLGVLSKKFTNLKILYLGDNKIKDLNHIDVIKDLKLEELKLAGNPLCHKYKSRQNDYISDVRKRFPKLLRLDGAELPRPILFDVVDDGAKTPPPRRMFVTNAKAQEVASQFLQQYFLIFDSENRQPLLDAYNEHASFSMTISHNGVKLNAYYAENRNLFRFNDPIRRQKLLKQGRLPVVSCISEMPQTSHYLNTFTMDISLVTEGMMLITVTGLFKELDNKEQLIRYFNRTFIIVPEGSGYCIRNEQLHIGNPTEMQLKQLNSLPSEAQMSELASTSQASASTIVKPIPTQPTEEVKQQMTLTLSQQTNMNLEWSLKCLAEVQWNYDNALSAFQEFFKRGQIPAEAFNK